MRSTTPPLTVGTPCPKRWGELAGDDKRRFCEQCQLHVHNLSGMSAPEREHFVAESGGKACIAYELRPDGSMVTPSRWGWLLQPVYRFRFAMAAFLAALLPVVFTGCASRRAQVMGGMVAPSCNASSQSKIEAQLGNEIVLGVPLPPPKAGQK